MTPADHEELADLAREVAAPTAEALAAALEERDALLRDLKAAVPALEFHVVFVMGPKRLLAERLLGQARATIARVEGTLLQ